MNKKINGATNGGSEDGSGPGQVDKCAYFLSLAFTCSCNSVLSWLTVFTMAIMSINLRKVTLTAFAISRMVLRMCLTDEGGFLLILWEHLGTERLRSLHVQTH